MFFLPSSRTSDNPAERMLARTRPVQHALPGLATAVLVLAVIVTSSRDELTPLLLCVSGLPLLHLVCSARAFTLPWRVRRGGRAADLLMTPVSSKDFARAFHKVFWSAALWTTLAAVVCLAVVYAGIAHNPGNFVEYLPNICFWSASSLLTLAWVAFWSLIRSRAWGWLIPLTLLLGTGLSFKLRDPLVDGVLAQLLVAVPTWWSIGLFLYLDCRDHFADRLRRHVFP